MLTIHYTRVLRGPNIWASVPVIALTVAIGELEARLERETPNFFEGLITLLPSLESHRATVGRPELGFARLLLGPIALAVQQQAGAAVDLAQTHPTAAPGVYTVVYGYQHQGVGRSAGKLAVRLLNHLLYGNEPEFDFAHVVEEKIIRLTERDALGPFLDTIAAAAKRRGIPVLELSTSPPLLQLGTGAYLRHLEGSVPDETGTAATSIAGNRTRTRRLLGGAGMPVSSEIVVRDVDSAVQVARRLGFPVVLDLGQRRDHGPRSDLVSEAAVREAFSRIAQQTSSGRVVVKRAAPGTLYHLLLVGEQVVAVAERGPAPSPEDGSPEGAKSVAARVDQETEPVLTPPDLSQQDIADDDPFVPLPATGHRVAGGIRIAIDRTTEVHPDTVTIARHAARLLGLEVAGIDVITPDIGRTILESGGVIVDVDPTPDLRLHTHPSDGMPRDVGMAIVDHLFPPGQPTRVPVVAITGTNGKTTTTRLIAHIMTTAGRRVGMTTSNGLDIAGLPLAIGDQAGAAGAGNVLRHPAVDYAVLEITHGHILATGLAFDRCDVAVVTNVAGDHVGTLGITTIEDLARVKAVVPRAVVPAGASVLNADDPLTVAMAEVSGGEILFFSMSEDSMVVDAHVQRGGRAVVLRQRAGEEILTLLADGEATEILPVAEIPATMEGRIQVNIANALAATAATIAQDVPVETIRAALRTFANSVVQTPGRFNVLEINGRTVLVDYCHNLHGLEAMADFVKRMAAPHTVAAIYMPADRPDEHITDFGRLAAQIFDDLVIRDAHPEYQRGRKPGEVPALLQAAAIAGGLAPEKISLAHDRQEAVDMAMAKSGRGSLVVLLGADDPAAIWNYLTQQHHEAPV
jgi:cyanophycin synthetase